MPITTDHVCAHGRVAHGHVRAARDGTAAAAQKLRDIITHRRTRPFSVVGEFLLTHVWGLAYPSDVYVQQALLVINRLDELSDVLAEVTQTLDDELKVIEEHANPDDIPTGLAHLSPIPERILTCADTLELTRLGLVWARDRYVKVTGWPGGDVVYVTEIQHLVTFTESGRDALDENVLPPLRTVVAALEQMAAGQNGLSRP